MLSRLIRAIRSPREAVLYFLAGKERYQESLSTGGGMATYEQAMSMKRPILETRFLGRRVGTLVDHELVQVVRKLKDDFGLKNFVETGTFQGETSFFFSGIFDRVFTCDVVDWHRRIEFYCLPNLVYETKSSPRFLLDHIEEMRLKSFFFLDAHWGDYWPLRDELRIIFGNCEDPIVLIDDFDVGNGLGYDTYKGVALNFDCVEDLIPPNYKYFVNDSSIRNRGMVFAFPEYVEYGCHFRERSKYNQAKHSLWGRSVPQKGEKSTDWPVLAGRP